MREPYTDSAQERFFPWNAEIPEARTRKYSYAPGRHDDEIPRSAA